MATVKTKRKKPTGSPGIIRSLSVTSVDTRTLDRVSREAPDYIGWTVSGSAIVRALLRYADRRLPLIE